MATLGMKLPGRGICQQSRILVNARKSELANWNRRMFSFIDNIKKNNDFLYYKCCQKLVPEDSVRLETRTLVIINRRKGFVGVFKSLL
jgi:hypothetical protein